MGIDRFTDLEWEAASERLKASRANLSFEFFKTLLVTPVMRQKLLDAKGAEWTLDDALDLITPMYPAPKEGKKKGRPPGKRDLGQVVRVDEELDCGGCTC